MYVFFLEFWLVHYYNEEANCWTTSGLIAKCGNYIFQNHLDDIWTAFVAPKSVLLSELLVSSQMCKDMSQHFSDSAGVWFLFCIVKP